MTTGNNPRVIIDPPSNPQGFIAADCVRGNVLGMRIALSAGEGGNTPLPGVGVDSIGVATFTNPQGTLGKPEITFTAGIMTVRSLKDDGTVQTLDDSELYVIVLVGP